MFRPNLIFENEKRPVNLLAMNAKRLKVVDLVLVIGSGLGRAPVSKLPEGVRKSVPIVMFGQGSVQITSPRHLLVNDEC